MNINKHLTLFHQIPNVSLKFINGFVLSASQTENLELRKERDRLARQLRDLNSRQGQGAQQQQQQAGQPFQGQHDKD